MSGDFVEWKIFVVEISNFCGYKIFVVEISNICRGVEVSWVEILPAERSKSFCRSKTYWVVIPNIFVGWKFSRSGNFEIFYKLKLCVSGIFRERFKYLSGKYEKFSEWRFQIFYKPKVCASGSFETLASVIPNIFVDCGFSRSGSWKFLSTGNFIGLNTL